MFEKYPSISPYTYCANNPVMFVDPDEMAPGPFDPKRAIANAIINSAEIAYGLYQGVAGMVNKNPSLTGYANRLVSVAAAGARAVTDMNPNTMGWGDLTNIWLFELGNSSTIRFGANASTTKDLQQQAGVSQARSQAMEQITSGDIKGVSNTWVYGQSEFYDGISEGNVVTSFLGSYNTNVTITPNENGSYTLNYTVTNTTGWESGTRLRKDNDGNGQHDPIIPNKRRGEEIKLGGNLRQIWTWSETVNP
jgi:hypothetical protein